MGKTILLKSMLLLCALIVGSTSLWGGTSIYTFTSSGWNATIGGNPANWSSGKAGNSFTANQGVQVTTGVTGANATSPVSFDGISQIIVTYNTNKSAGEGTIKIKVGTNEEVSNAVAYSSGDGRSAMYTSTFNFSPSQTGAVKITVETTINSIFVHSITIKHAGKDAAGLSYGTSTYRVPFEASFSTPTLTNPNGLAVTYATSDATIADVNSSTGAVTIKSKSGKAIITASFAGNEDYLAGDASYKIIVYDPDGGDGSQADPFDVITAIGFIEAKEYDTEAVYYVKGTVSQVGTLVAATGKLTYFISDDGSTTNQLQVYRGLSLSETKFASTSDLAAGVDEVIVVGPLTYYNNTTPEIIDGNYLYKKGTIVSPSLTVSDRNMEITEEIDIADIYTTNSTGTVTVTSSATDVANVVGGKLKANKVGSANITVSIEASGTWAAVSKTFALTVTVKDMILPVGASYNLVTNSSAPLANGDKLLVVGKNGGNAFVMTYQGGHIRNAKPITITDDKISIIPAEAQLVTLEQDETYWNFNVGDDAYLYASGGTSNNYVDTDTKATAGTKTKATISTDGAGAATVTFNISGSGARNLFRFNYNSGNPRFTCYSSGQTAVNLYRYEMPTTSYDISIGAAGWRTIVPAASASLPSGLKAYIVTGDVDGGKATLTEVASIKAGEAYVLNGDEGDYTLTVIDSPAEPTGNKLRVSTESDGNGAYVLANKLHGVGFYLWNGGSLGAGRVILPADAVTSAREFIAFDNETTGIKNLTPAISQGEGAWYDLQGRKVAQPTKGLYIVNGQKVVLK